MSRAAFCVSSKKEGGTHHSKRDQKSLHRHRNADCQRNRPAGAALPPRYQVKRVGRFHTTAEMDSLRIKDRCTWFRYSQNTGGDAITFLQQYCGKSFSEAVEYLLTFHGKARDTPAPQCG